MIQLQSMNIAKAAEDASRVLMFDQWMRYYFVTKEDDKLFLRIPEQTAEEIKASEPNYVSLLEMVNGEELTYEKNQATVCAFIGARFDGSKYSADIMPRVFDSKEFKLEMYVFNLWLKGHEKYLDEQYHSFADWMEMYAEWKKMDEVQAYLARLEKTAAAGEPESDTLQ